MTKLHDFVKKDRQYKKHLVLTKIYDLSTENGFRNAEKYKSYLESRGYSVKVETYGIDKVRIAGVL